VKMKKSDEQPNEHRDTSYTLPPWASAKDKKRTQQDKKHKRLVHLSCDMRSVYLTRQTAAPYAAFARACATLCVVTFFPQFAKHQFHQNPS
jgi:hypothetical protein